jgi:magnesium chelatase family protein
MTATDLSLPPPAEGTAEAAARVGAARARQAARYCEGDRGDLRGRRAVNADAPAADIEAIAAPDDAARALLAKAADQLHLSARAYHRVLKVARTIADLDGAGGVGRVHVAEALTYRYRPPQPAHRAASPLNA